MNTTGLVYNMPADVYHGHVGALSSGYVRALLQGPPARVRLTRERTPAMAFGSLVHDLLAGGCGDYIAAPFDSFRSKAAQDWRDEQTRAGKTVVTQSDWERAKAVAAAVCRSLDCGLSVDPLRDGKPEVSAFWEEQGVQCRARFDRLCCDGIDPQAEVWDWKTCSDISDRGIEKAIQSHRYDVQAAFYLRGLRACVPSASRPSFIFCFVEVEEPFAVRRVVLSEEYLRIGNAEVNRALPIWRECQTTNNWPDYSAETLTVEPPAWMEQEQPLTGMTAA